MGSPFSRPGSIGQIRFSRPTRFLFLSARSAAVSEPAPSVLIQEVTESTRIRTRPPSGSRPWGGSSRSSYPAPGSCGFGSTQRESLRFLEPQRVLGPGG